MEFKHFIKFLHQTGTACTVNIVFTSDRPVQHVQCIQYLHQTGTACTVHTVFTSD